MAQPAWQYLARCLRSALSCNMWELEKRAFRGMQPPLSDDAPRSSYLHLIAAAGAHNNHVRLPLPQSLVDALGGAATLRTIGSVSRGHVSASLELSLPAAVVGSEVMDGVVDCIVQLAAEVTGEGRRLGNECSKVLLAGGFARSPYLQSRVRNALPPGASLLLPADPGAAVVTGSVIFGARPYTVSARRCRLSYGLQMCEPWSDEHAAHAAIHGMPQKLPGMNVARGIYSSFVERGQLLRTDEAVTHTFYPLHRWQTAVSFPLYATPHTSARYTFEAGMQQLAAVTLQLPKGWASRVRDSNYPLQAEMRFGATELSLVASDPSTKDAVATSIQWHLDAA